MSRTLAAALCAGTALLLATSGCIECDRRTDCAMDETCEDGACVPYNVPDDLGGGGGGGGGPDPPPTGSATTGEACTGSSACAAGLECVGTYCVGAGVQRVSMVFDGATDMDLHLIFPSGEEIYYGNRTVGSGTLDVDQCVNSAACVGSSHVENIFFTAAPSSGSYTIRARNFNGAAASNVTIEVVGLSNSVFTGFVSATSGEQLEFFTAM
jgi:hypothetical protein